MLGAGLALSCEMLRTEAEVNGLPGSSSVHRAASPRDTASGSPGSTSRTIPPEPSGLTRIARSSASTGEVAQSEVAVDALIDAAELVGTLRCCPGPRQSDEVPFRCPFFPSEIAFLLGVIQ